MRIILVNYNVSNPYTVSIMYGLRDFRIVADTAQIEALA